MIQKRGKNKMVSGTPFHRTLFYLVLVFAFGLPLSIAVAEPVAFLAIPCFFLACPREERARVFQSPQLIPIMSFVLIVLASVFWSERPDMSLRKLHTVLLVSLVFILPFALRGKDVRMDAWWLPLLCFIAGASLLALYDLFRIPLAFRSGEDLFSAGNMRDPQLYMVALCFIVAGLSYRFKGTLQNVLYVALGLNLLGVILHFKRGVWVACGLAIIQMAVVSRRIRWVVFLLVVLGAMALAPPVQQRLAEIDEVFSRHTGGRYVLWTRVAPQLLRAHPEGIGWSAVRHEDFAPFAQFVQPGLDHLHNNPLQLALELGWAGLAIWLAWMGVTFTTLWAIARGSRGGDKERSTGFAALGCLGAFTGLMLNGLVEHNFGDTEILMTLALLMGISVCLYQASLTGDELQGAPSSD
jgi:hypothetical protein